MNDKKVVRIETAPEIKKKPEGDKVPSAKDMGVDWTQVRIEAIKNLFNNK
jgi:hypothetical protein